MDLLSLMSLIDLARTGMMLVVRWRMETLDSGPGDDPNKEVPICHLDQPPCLATSLCPQQSVILSWYLRSPWASGLNICGTSR